MLDSVKALLSPRSAGEGAYFFLKPVRGINITGAYSRSYISNVTFERNKNGFYNVLVLYYNAFSQNNKHNYK